MNSDFSKNISEVIWKMKGVAILSVVAAHCNLQIDGSILSIIKSILNNFGTLGVGVFFFASGFYFNTKKMSTKKFMYSRVQKHIIPWFLAATCVWLYIVLRKGGFNCESLFKYIIGNGSIYYFMFDLLILQTLIFVIEKLLDNMVPILLTIIGVSEVAIILESLQISFFPTPYMNFFCFAGYFAFGMICSRIDLLERIIDFFDKKPVLLIVLSAFSLFLIVQPFYTLSYFRDCFSFLIEIVFTVTLIVLLWKVKGFYLKTIGKISFFIYLWHIPLAGIISNLGSRNFYVAHTAIIWPIVIILIMLGCSKVVEVCKFEVCKRFIGLR